MIAPVCAYKGRHAHAYVFAYACTGMIAPMCAYMRRHDCACVCIYGQACSHLCICIYVYRHDYTQCVHILAGTIAPLCARNMRACGNESTESSRREPNVNILKGMTVCMDRHVYETLRPVIWHRARHIVWAFMATIRRDLAHNTGCLLLT